MRHDEGEFVYDVRATPDERPEDNRVDDDLPVHNELTEALDRHRREMERSRSSERGIDQDSEMVEEHLKDLGYME
jgi:hypothetical protein